MLYFAKPDLTIEYIKWICDEVEASVNLCESAENLVTYAF